jgi:hypothetical protein
MNTSVPAAIGTFAKGDDQQQLLNLLNDGDEVGRPFIMSKEVPADYLAMKVAVKVTAAASA